MVRKFILIAVLMMFPSTLNGCSQFVDKPVVNPPSISLTREKFVDNGKEQFIIVTYPKNVDKVDSWYDDMTENYVSVARIKK